MRIGKSLLAFVILGVGCDAATMPLDPLLPTGSSIPSGIYSGSLTLNVSATVGGDEDIQTTDTPFTLVIDGNGRMLDADGIPFLVGKEYYVDAGTIQMELFTKSISAVEFQIVLRFSVSANVDLGQVSGTFTGSQTDTLSFNSDSGELHFVRSQTYGGVGSDGTAISIRTTGDATLRNE